jgi:thiamine pyrophosphate-dependent acetolactate synthase large subunit-like protein
VVLSLVGDGGFGQNPAMLATAVELNLGIIWLVMNNNAFGTIAGLQKAHYGLPMALPSQELLKNQKMDQIILKLQRHMVPWA